MKFISKDDVYNRMHWLDSEAGDNFEAVYTEILEDLSQDIKVPFQNIKCTEAFDDLKFAVVINGKEFTHTLKHFGSDYIDESIFSLVNWILRVVAPNYKLYHDPSMMQEIMWGVFTEEEFSEIKSIKDVFIEPYVIEEVSISLNV